MAYKILVIDDEPDIVETVKFRLESKGYEVIPAFDGVEGLEKFKRQSPDLIIVDVLMPKMNGYTFVRRLRSISPDTPVIVLTIKKELENLFNLEDISHYLVKPFNPEELLEKVRDSLGQK